MKNDVNTATVVYVLYVVFIAVNFRYFHFILFLAHM